MTEKTLNMFKMTFSFFHGKFVPEFVQAVDCFI